MTYYPTKLARTADGQLRIDWNDGRTRTYSIRELRDRCPCATCREKRNAPPAAPNPLAVLSPAETQPLTLEGMDPVGRYAYSLRFSDGHDTGIFTFDLLRELGQNAVS